MKLRISLGIKTSVAMHGEHYLQIHEP